MKTYAFSVAVLLFLLGSTESQAVVHIVGTAAQRAKIANWLTLSLGEQVGVDANGNLTIGPGGNAAANRLRIMIDAANPPVNLVVIDPSADVSRGGWQSAVPADAKSPSNGDQLIDISDIESIGNIFNDNGDTPDRVLIHEITEVYEGFKNGMSYEDAHKIGLAAEKELMAAYGTSFVFRFRSEGGYTYRKIKRSDGTFRVVRFKPRDVPQNQEWFLERIPCSFETQKLILIPDPDPMVHVFNYNYDLSHSYANSIDSINSRPTGVAIDSSKRVFVTENFLSGQDEVRVLSLQGALLTTITHPQLVNPEGIDIDKASGDVFIAVEGRVMRFNNAGSLLGSYSTSNPNFRPTDVAVWRNNGTEDIQGDGSIYDIFVSDRNSSQVYRFRVLSDMNTGTYFNAFGGGVLSSPEGISVDSWWTVWVASTGNHRIYRFTPAGNLEPFHGTQFFLEDASKTFFDMAMVDDDGLYVVDETPGQGKLLLYDFDAILVNTYGAGTLQCPSSLAIAFFQDTSNLVPIGDPSGGGGTIVPSLKEWGVAGLAGTMVIVGLVLLHRRFRRLEKKVKTAR